MTTSQKPLTRVDYKTVLLSRAESQEDPPRALSPLQLRNRQSLEEWRLRLARHYAEGAA